MASEVPFVVHPGIRPGVLEDRLYQSRIASTAVEHNTLAVLPTGLGKTAIALRVIAEYLQRFPGKSILFMAPTRPLVAQHARSIESSLLLPSAPVVFTGTVTPSKRAEPVAGQRVVCATPQVIAHDLARGTVRLEEFSLLVFDEAHRAVGDYPYVAIGLANRRGPSVRVLAMTASPGGRIERIRAVWANLGIEHFEYRTADDADVRPYFHGVGVETVPVPLPPAVRELATEIRAALQTQTQKLYRAGRLGTPDASRRELLALQADLRRTTSAHRARGEPIPPGLWGVITSIAIAMKIAHALELIETQGVEALREYFERQEKQVRAHPTPAGRAFLNDPYVQRARSGLAGVSLEHPKLDVAARIVTEQLHQAPGSRVIVFTQYRQTAERLVDRFRELQDPSVHAERFVGQASHGEDEGLTQREQGAILDSFRRGERNVLVATSVAEEGLDIPATDLVVFYEPVPDVIRTIQRRGRTGRARLGRAVVLVAEGTRDEGIHRGARSRERRMHEMLETVELEASHGVVRAPATPSIQSRLEEF